MESHQIKAIVGAATVLLVLASCLEAKEPVVLKIWPNGAPDEATEIGPEKTMPPRGEKTVTRLTDVSEPTITVYQPPTDRANGCAVVVCPGGGYHILAYDLEGTEVAEWFQSIGVTAVLLKYRVPRRDKDAPHKAPLQDAQRTLRLTRQHADDWGIDPRRIGILGFSAGGNLAVMAATHWSETTYSKVDAADQLSCRPDFQIPVYPAYLHDENDSSRLSPLVQVSDRTPPAFLVVTHDDANRDVYAALYYAALKRAGVPAELHVFLKGGHGYGLRPSDHPVSKWPKMCHQWMIAMQLLKPHP